MARPKLGYLFPRGIVLWGSLTVLTTLGLLTTLVDLSGLAARESARASSEQQRLIFDPDGHMVSQSGTRAAEPSFDVAAAEPEKPETHATEEPAQAQANAPAEVVEPAAVAKEEPLASTEAAAAEKPVEAQKPDEHTAPPIKAEEPKTSAAETAPPAASAASVETPIAALTPLKTEPLPSAPPAAAPASRDSLIRAPAPEITETVNGVKIPKRGNNDTAASTLYARRFAPVEDQHTVSFVVLDAGLGTSTLPLLLALPKDVTIAFSPYSRGAAANIELLRNVGFEVWGMVPTMGERYPQDDPGPLGLIQSMPKEELLRRLHEVMATTIGSVGMVLPPDETLSGRPNSFGHLVNDVHARGLYLLSTHPSRSIDQLSTGPETRASLARADIILDPLPNEPQIKSKLASITAASKEKQRLIVVLSARPQSLALLQQWLNSTPGIKLAPLSANYKKPDAPEPVAEEKGGHGAPEKKPEAKPAEKSKAGGH